MFLAINFQKTQLNVELLEAAREMWRVFSLSYIKGKDIPNVCGQQTSRCLGAPLKFQNMDFMLETRDSGGIVMPEIARFLPNQVT